MTLKFAFVIFLAASFARCFNAAAEEPRAPAEIDVILWFDTEDYLLPADDDAAKRLAEMLTARGIRATFKVVGEKARVLKQRGRNDVIEALKKHDIGYHSDFHSVHPTPSEYLAECGLLDGIAEFERREKRGVADILRIFDLKTLSCYGQPGSSWGSQAICALPLIGVAPHGIPCYVDEGTHIGLDEKPFWYCGALNVFHMGANKTRMELHDPKVVEQAKEKVTGMADRLRKEGGGLISIYYHPCEWVHREFWDGVNFKRGANPPRELWKAPAQRTEEETNAAFERFGAYIDHIRAIPGARFVTASDLPELYPDAVRKGKASDATLDAIAAGLLDEKITGVDFIVTGGNSYSVADQYQQLAERVYEMNFLQGGSNHPPLPGGILGPDSAPPPHSDKTKLTWTEFMDAVRDTNNYVATQHRIPSRIFIGPDSIPPSDFLVALASGYAKLRAIKAIKADETVTLRPMELLPAKRVAEDTPKLFGDWVIHKEGFRAPKILDIARLQTWTLKPAIRASK